MVRSYRWVPDTHPNYQLDLEYDEVNPDAPHTCVRAVWGDADLDDPQGVYAQVLKENQAKNIAMVILAKGLPLEMTKLSVDSDGDRMLDDNQQEVRVIKDKHYPVMEPTALGEPTILKIPGITEEVQAAMELATPAEVTIQKG